tara:strand:+ start:224 stop:748 length:525 start_codon:yes stop_codon:yes gene_type:complete
MTKIKPLPLLKDLQNAFIYDPDTGILINRNTGTIQNCLDSRGRYIIAIYKGKNYQSARICYYLGTGNNPGRFQIDHKDQNKQNNKLNNLRLKNNSEQQRNTKLRSCNKSGVRGVCWDKKAEKWVAYITINLKKIKLYYGYNKDHAIKARIKAEKKYYPDMYPLQKFPLKSNKKR